MIFYRVEQSFELPDGYIVEAGAVVKESDLPSEMLADLRAEDFICPTMAIEGEAPQTAAPSVATPAALELAEELGLDISEVEGTGADGRITKGDVQRELEPPVEDMIDELVDED